MILGEVTLTISLIYLQIHLKNTLYRGSNSYNFFDIFTNALLENDLRGSNSYNLFDIFTNAITEYTIWGSNSYNLFDIFTNAILEHTV